MDFDSFWILQCGGRSILTAEANGDRVHPRGYSLVVEEVLFDLEADSKLGKKVCKNEQFEGCRLVERRLAARRFYFSLVMGRHPATASSRATCSSVSLIRLSMSGLGRTNFSSSTLYSSF